MLKRENGFTLIEIAIVLIIIGIGVAAATSIYTQYRIEKDLETTQENIDTALNDIQNFYQTYGRYPCPASMNATVGDAEYGIEKANCTADAPGTCADGVCTVASDLGGGETVMIGALPFKKLNMQEREIMDGYLNRYTYAVTTSLTDDQTFNPAGGGIGVQDGNGNSMVIPQNSAHFVLLSHGRDKDGSTTFSGALASACTVGAADEENCDGDAQFISREIDTDFDDFVHFHVQATPTEWKSDEDNTSITLKEKEQIIVGANAGDSATDVEEVTVRKYSSGNDGRGNIRADNRIYAEELCEEDLDNCFQPRRIGGDLTPEPPANPGEPTLYYEDGSGNGISCYTPGQGMRYLRGISNGQPDCADEITLECPDGQFITSVVDGRIRCNIILENCPAQQVTTFCGDTQSIPESAPGEYQSVYSGECRYITDYSAADLEASMAAMNVDAARTYVTTLNTEERNMQACDQGAYTSQIRDSYRCDPDGWTTLTPHEKGNPWSTFPGNLEQSSGSPVAENSYDGPDSSNSNYYHDCWCREDYRVIPQACPNGDNDAYVVQKHRCPQTYHRWETVYRNEEFCGCSAEPVIEEVSCNAFYDQVNSPDEPTTGLSGNVQLTYNVTCQGNVPVRDEDYTSADTSQCACLDGNPNEVRYYCPEGQTNNWTNSLGQQEIGVESIERTPWICPNTTSNDLPDPGYIDYDDQTTEVATDPCACNPEASRFVTRSCDDGLQGGGITYEVPYNCAAGDWEADDNLWVEVDNDCHSCTWQASGGGTLQSVALGVERGSGCSCGSEPEPFCYRTNGAHNYRIWNNCQCTVQVD